MESATLLTPLAPAYKCIFLLSVSTHMQIKKKINSISKQGRCFTTSCGTTTAAVAYKYSAKTDPSEVFKNQTLFNSVKS